MKTEGSQNNVHTVFTTVEPPRSLYGAIMARIELAKRRAAKMRAVLFGVVAGFCAAAIVPVLQYTAEQLYASGFEDYLSLMFSDRNLFFAYWREFGFSLLESLPSLALLVLLPVTAVLVWSFLRMIKNARTGFFAVQVSA